MVLVGCGSSYHASLVARYAIERLARIGAEVDIASEFRFRDSVLDERTLVVFVSQSGETIDTLHALRRAQKGGAMTLAVTNVVDSAMAREADGVIYTHAGPEIGVASTKATMAQIALLEAFALHLARVRDTVGVRELAASASALLDAPRLVEAVLGRIEVYEATARSFAGVRDVFYLGRGIGYPVALEGALKLKELAYVRAEAYPAGELKHGPIALIDKTSLVVAIVTDPTMREKVISNIEEVRARGAVILSLCTDGDEAVASLSDGVFEVPRPTSSCHRCSRSCRSSARRTRSPRRWAMTSTDHATSRRSSPSSDRRPLATRAVIGIGLDSVDISRFRTVIGRRPGLVARVFSDHERTTVAGRVDPAPGLAARFAAKEATMKALGVGIGGVDFHDVEVVTSPGGAPSLLLSGARRPARGRSRRDDGARFAHPHRRSRERDRPRANETGVRPA